MPAFIVRMAAGVFVNRKYRLGLVMAVVTVVGINVRSASAVAQTATQAALPEFIQKAQTVHIPIIAVDHDTTLPVKNLTASDLVLDVDGKPRAFTLSRPWDRTINPKTGQPEDRPNLLIILPFDGPQYRKDALDEAIADLSREPDLGWNISILDDGGEQTPYTRDLKTVIAQLEQLQKEEPAETDLDTWRLTASLAIATMRDLPGRRVVMSLGDIYHEMVYQGMQLVYENFEAHDIAAAARNAGAVIYAAESFQEIGRLRGLFPYYYTVGFGPWMLLTRDDHFEGWISNFVSDTIKEIQQDGMGAYDLGLHLDVKQMDGRPHAVSVTAPTRQKMILNAPAYYIAPDARQLQELSGVSPVLRHALKNPPPLHSSPLELATQLAYFPHADGRTGTQIATTGFFWTQTTPPPKSLEVALQLEQTSSGFFMNTTVGRLDWNARQPVWNTAMEVTPGAYVLRVAAANAAGKIAAAADTPFNVEPTGDENVLISSLVLGKSCVFAPPSPDTAAAAKSRDYLRAGNCDLMPDPGHYYSPQDIAWTLVRITPIGKLAKRPSKDWKGTFLIVDEKGSKLAEEPAHWLTASDGSYVATTAFPLDNPKLKLTNGEYAVVFKLKGPGIEPGYGEDAPFLVYGAEEAGPDSKR